MTVTRGFPGAQVSRLTVAPRANQTTLQQKFVSAAIALPLLLVTPEADAVGLESFDLPAGPSIPNPAKNVQERSAKVLEKAEEEFQNSDLLSILKANSEENKQKNKRAIENKYCQRQAELGVGDCGGLRFIPGATKSGKQRTPDWLADLLGIEKQPESTLDLFKD